MFCTVDLRIQWIQSEFLPWLQNWENQVTSRKDLKARERNNLILSQETLMGIRISAYSFIDLLKYIFTIKSFLSEPISQDPLEKYFGRQRQRGRVNENPSCHQFLQNNNALRMVNLIKIETHRGNVNSSSESKDLPIISTEPLPKRKKITEQTPFPTAALETEVTLLNKGYNISSAEAFDAKVTAEKMKEWLLKGDYKESMTYSTAPKKAK